MDDLPAQSSLKNDETLLKKLNGQAFQIFKALYPDKALPVQVIIKVNHYIMKEFELSN